MTRPGLQCATVFGLLRAAFDRAQPRPAPSLELWSDEGDKYLTRWELLARTPRLAQLPTWLRYLCDWRVTLHQIEGGDPDRGPHNHPWWAVCFVLRGGYIQLRRTDSGSNFELINWVNVLRLSEYHRITNVRPNTWTLCVMGPHIRDWGFMRDGVHVDAPSQAE